MPKQILLVDDSVTIHRVVEITFAQEDFAITAVKSADEGLDRARQMKPDVVLLDAGMPGKSGYDICGALRQDGALSKTACLILTGNFTPYDEVKGGSAGADGFVVKPFESQGLIDKVKDAIARRTGGEVPRPVAAASSAPSPVPARAGIEALGKPLSTVAAETSARIPAQPPAAARPAPLPVPAAPVAVAPPVQPVQAQQRPAPKATLMGIPAVNPASVGAPPMMQPPAPAKPIQTPSQPHSVLQPPPKAQPASPSQPIRIEPPKPAPAPAPMPARLEPPAKAASAPPAAAAPNALPQNVPQMPRPSLVPGVGVPMKGGNLDAAVSAVAAKLAARGPEFEAIAKLSRELIEQVVWEVVPDLAETIIRAELDRLVRERQNA